MLKPKGFVNITPQDKYYPDPRGDRRYAGAVPKAKGTARLERGGGDRGGCGL